MKHLGDVCKIHDAEPVWIICGGSPCQDLSIANRVRKGLLHTDKGDEETTRSGLFMEQIRIIKEMRENDRRAGRTDEFIRPRFMVFENVPGIFSTNDGEDFRIVLEEIARIAEPDAHVPRPERWSSVGCIMGHGRFSLAWRVCNSRFWGVPQNRRRLTLVADFAGGGAPQVLFERTNLQVDSATDEREKDSEAPADGVGEAISFQVRCGCDGGGKGILIQNDRVGALSTLTNQFVLAKAYRKKTHPHSIDEGQGWEEASASDTLNTFDNAEQRTTMLVVNKDDDDYVVRRLTPLEFERLQGFPDYWTHIGDWTDSKGKIHKDSDAVKFRALGNSIALPMWQWIADRIVKVLKNEGIKPTMASLFDGIGGFPLVFSRAGCEPIWASEIEEFPIAVTKKHFPEKGE